MSMLEDRFDQLEARYEELSTESAQPEVIADLSRWQEILKEHAQLEAPVLAWRAYQRLRKEILSAEELLTHPDMAQAAREELALLRAREADALQDLKFFLLPEDPRDGRGVVMEIRAGAGGDEASLFGALLLRMYTRYAERRGYRVEYLSVSSTELGGVREAVFLLNGKRAYSRMKYESGVHRVQRIPSTESSGRIHTSTATVAVLPEADEVEADIHPGDLRIDVFRASGHGGQHVNKTDSAVRITHFPSGLVVTSQDEKSQLKNKEQAMRVLRSRLFDMKQAEQDAATSQNRRLQVGTGDRSERIRTYNFPQGRVTDHRIGMTLHRIDEVMDGDLDEFIDALTIEAQGRALRAVTSSDSDAQAP